jgi:hypothetical protein
MNNYHLYHDGYKQEEYSIKQQSLKQWYKLIPMEYFLSMAFGVILLQLIVIKGVTGIGEVVGFMLFSSIVIIYCGLTYTPLTYKKWLRKGGTYPTVGAIAFVILFAGLMVDSSNAQFLNGAESFIKNSLCQSLLQAATGAGGQGTNNASTTQAQDMVGMTGLFFTVLRVIMILYILTSIIKILNAAREDEDWKALAKTPLIVVIALVIGDSLVALVTGGGTGIATNNTGGTVVCN